MAIKKLGILVGGGPAPGINGAISAAALEAIKHGSTAIGFHDGFEWLTQRYTDEQHELTVDEVSRIHFDRWLWESGLLERGWMEMEDQK